MTVAPDLLVSRVWAATLPTLRAIRAGQLVASPEVWAARGQPKAAGDVAIVPIMGVLTQRGGWFGTSVETVRQSFRSAMADGSRAVVLEIDSPGGEVFGIEELATEIREARGGKPVVAVSNALAASAAYYLAAQADELFVTPSGEVGSIGVYGMHMDWSGALDQMGIAITFISAGDGKVEGNMFQPLTEDAKADMQEDVDRYYKMFVDSVKKGRSNAGRSVSVETIRSDWQAWVYGGPEAVQIGMADRVGTVEDAVRRAGQMARERGSKAASIELEGQVRTRQRARA